MSLNTTTLDDLIEDCDSGGDDGDQKDDQNDSQFDEFDSPQLKEESDELYEDYKETNEENLQNYAQNQTQNYHFECNICYKSFQTKVAEKYHIKGPCRNGKLMRVSNIDDDDDSFDDLSNSYNESKNYDSSSIKFENGLSRRNGKLMSVSKIEDEDSFDDLSNSYNESKNYDLSSIKFENGLSRRNGKLMRDSKIDNEDNFDDLSNSYNESENYDSSSIKFENGLSLEDYESSYIKRAEKLSRSLKEDGDEWDIEVQDGSGEKQNGVNGSFLSIKEKNKKLLPLPKGYEKNDKKSSNSKPLNGSKKMYYCDLCSYSSAKRHHVQIHLKLKKHEPNEPHIKLNRARGKDGKETFYCDQCSYTSHTKDNYQRHAQYVHTDYRPAQCPKCPYAGKSKYDLNTHYKRHEMTYHFKCNVCDRTFRSIKSVKYHKTKVCTEAYFYKIDNDNEEVQPLRKCLPKFYGTHYKEDEEEKQKEQEPPKVVTFSSLKVKNDSNDSPDDSYFEKNFLNLISIEEINAM